MRPRLNLKALEALPPGPEREEAERLLAELDAVAEANPLAFFEPHPPQRPFFEARTAIVAALAGNRFGKTTGLVCRSLLECLDEDWLPEGLRCFKRWSKASSAPRGTFGRIVNPSFALLESVILPAFRQWTPAGALRGGGFDKAYKGPPDRKLHFANGSWVQFMTHEQELDKFGGSALHFVGYDEPPPREIREECMMRLADFDGYEMFAMTPLKANTAWIRRDIYKKREAPHITVVRGSIHDNPHLSESAKQRILSEIGNDLWRQAREFGDFVEVGGLVYPEFEPAVISAPSVTRVRAGDTVVGIDPGIRNAGFVFVSFDDENVALVFDELLLQDATPPEYAREVRGVLERWGVVDPMFVIDPAARSRAQVNAESMESALAAEGIFCVHGQNQVEAGVAQVRTRLKHGRLLVSEECRGLRDEADEYAAEDRPDGEFRPIKANDHRLDALRYALMARPWDPVLEDEAPGRVLGWEPDRALSASQLRVPALSPPLGSLS